MGKMLATSSLALLSYGKDSFCEQVFGFIARAYPPKCSSSARSLPRGSQHSAGFFVSSNPLLGLNFCRASRSLRTHKEAVGDTRLPREGSPGCGLLRFEVWGSA